MGNAAKCIRKLYMKNWSLEIFKHTKPKRDMIKNKYIVLKRLNKYGNTDKICTGTHHGVQ